MKKVYAVTISIIFLFGVNIYLAFKNSDGYIPLVSKPEEDFTNNDARAYVLPISGPNYIPVLNSNVKRPYLEAKSAIVYDTRSARYLYDKNSDVKLPIASLTKVMTAVVALENLDMDDIVTIGEDSIRVDGEKQDLYLGEKISASNLLKLMLIESSNDAAYALSSYGKIKGVDFLSAMNQKALSIGMKNSNFLDVAGLNDNAYSTVQDLIKLVEYSLNYRGIWDISSEKTAIIESSDEKIRHSITSTNRLLGMIKDIIGGKTGYTEGAGQCMILVTNVEGYPSKLVSIVLGSDDRFGDTQKLIDWARTAYNWRQ
jgi:D-alanyl-D-alanine carboxypeptidase (penicillin-binding protein 5/6)